VCASRSVCYVAAIVFVGSVGLERIVSFDFGRGDPVPYPCPCLDLYRGQGRLGSHYARVLVGCAVGVQVAVRVAVGVVEIAVGRCLCGAGAELVEASVMPIVVAIALFVYVVSADGPECLEFVEGIAGVVVGLVGVLAEMEGVYALLEDVAVVARMCDESFGAVWRVGAAVLFVASPSAWRMGPLPGVCSERVDADGERAGVECPVGLEGAAPGPSCRCYLGTVIRCTLREGVYES
jgi:hypothetical protein